MRRHREYTARVWKYLFPDGVYCQVLDSNALRKGYEE
jgi:hypothetical protein